MREVPKSGPLVLKGGGQLTPLTPPGYGPVCGLDAQEAFDSIPHPVLFQKAMGTMSDSSTYGILN